MRGYSNNCDAWESDACCVCDRVRRQPGYRRVPNARARSAARAITRPSPTARRRSTTRSHRPQSPAGERWGDRSPLRRPPAAISRRVLDALQVPVASQMLAFAETSLQASQIRRDNPRAIYFNDDDLGGWIRGSDVLEVVGLRSRSRASSSTPCRSEAVDRPRFARTDNCLACHLSWDTLAVPGFVLQTVFPRQSEQDYADGGFVDHRMPIDGTLGRVVRDRQPGTGAAYGESADAAAEAAVGSGAEAGHGGTRVRHVAGTSPRTATSRRCWCSITRSTPQTC